jgi:PAS domain S-box-containing protein
MADRLPLWERFQKWILGWGILAKLAVSVTILTALPAMGFWLAMGHHGTPWAPALVLLTWGLSMGLLLLIIRFHLIAPIRSLIRASEALKTGNYQAPIPKVTGDETGRLAEAFDRMRQELGGVIESFRRARQEWEMIFNSIHEEIFLIGREGTILRTNEAVARRLGRPLETLIGGPCSLVCPGELMGDGECPCRKIFAGQSVAPMEARDPKSGRILLFSMYPVKGNRGEVQAVAGVVDDLTTLKQAEAEASKRETLRLLGEMAAGVVHDVNNILTIVLGYTEKAKARAGDLREVREALELVEKAALVGGETIRRIATFARVQQGRRERVPIALHPLIEECVTLCRHKWQDQALLSGEEIEVVADLNLACRVLANAAELKEVFINLIFNAVDAMPDGGTLTVRCFQEGEWAVAEVRDTGVGMSEEVKRRAFDPFFTTKGEHGSGLGLAIVRTIVEQHAGRIEVESQAGRGTTVRVQLPITTQEPAEPQTSRQILPTPPVMILVVEDQEDIRELIRDTLRKERGIVMAVANVSNAMWLFERGSFSLVITDLAMPGGSGLDLVRAVRGRRPEVPVILVTGYADLLDEESARLPTAVISKPFTASELIQAVRFALRRSH